MKRFGIIVVAVLTVFSNPLFCATQMDFRLHGVSYREAENQTVTIPPKLFQIWKTLQETLTYEVGGGLDFNLLKELERVKLSVGQSHRVSFIPDFEIAWHTHPKSHFSGKMSGFIPPSAADIQVGIAGSYNLWLAVEKKWNAQENKPLMLTAFSQDENNPLTVEVNIVAETQGVYVCKTVQATWEPVWQQGTQATSKKLKLIGVGLGQKISDLLVGIREGGLSIEQARWRYIDEVRNLAGVEVIFYPWEHVLEKGLEIRLNLVELLSSPSRIPSHFNE